MSSDKPLVSVVIPTYNRCGYLQQAVMSVLAQSYTELEVVVVDDGSVDETRHVVEDVGDARVRYLYQENAGRSVARNRGMAEAKGMYLALLDDDDRYLSHKLARQVPFLNARTGVDLVGAGAQLINGQGVVQGSWRPWEDQPCLTLGSCLYGCPLIPSTVLFRREVLKRLDHWFDPELSLGEDTDFFIRLLLVGCSMDWLQEVVSAYRVHGASSQSDGTRYSLAYQKLLDKWLAHPDVPPEVLADGDRLRARYHLVGACHEYAAGQVASAQRDLVRALALDPTLQSGNPPHLAIGIANFAGSFRVDDPQTYIDGVFDHLPVSLAHLRPLRRETLTAFYMGRMFKAHEAGAQPLLRDWLLGVWYAPRWLRNRGVWSILVRSIVGKKKLSLK